MWFSGLSLTNTVQNTHSTLLDVKYMNNWRCVSPKYYSIFKQRLKLLEASYILFSLFFNTLNIKWHYLVFGCVWRWTSHLNKLSTWNPRNLLWISTLRASPHNETFRTSSDVYIQKIMHCDFFVFTLILLLSSQFSRSWVIFLFNFSYFHHEIKW